MQGVKAFGKLADLYGFGPIIIDLLLQDFAQTDTQNYTTYKRKA